MYTAMKKRATKQYLNTDSTIITNQDIRQANKYKSIIVKQPSYCTPNAWLICWHRVFTDCLGSDNWTSFPATLTPPTVGLPWHELGSIDPVHCPQALGLLLGVGRATWPIRNGIRSASKGSSGQRHRRLRTRDFVLLGRFGMFIPGAQCKFNENTIKHRPVHYVSHAVQWKCTPRPK